MGILSRNVLWVALLAGVAFSLMGVGEIVFWLIA
jgi:hypothetical protein